MENYLYLLVNLACISIPLAFSFEKRVKFFKHWNAVVLAFVLVSLPFLAWDIAFTSAGVWGFNPTFLTGLYLLSLPIEEWLFFICIPYACLFTYAFVRYIRRKKKDLFPTKSILIVTICMFLLTIFSVNHIYSLFSFGLATIFLIIVLIMRPKWMNNFLIMFALILLPFIFSNGILTGLDFWKFPVLNSSPDVENMIVWYNNQENIGLRIFSIPVEDIFYAFSLLGFQVIILEKIAFRKAAKKIEMK